MGAFERKRTYDESMEICRSDLGDKFTITHEDLDSHEVVAFITEMFRVHLKKDFKKPSQV